MKSIAEQMHNYDREQMQRVAYGLPEQYEPRQHVEQTAQIFNELFNQLRVAFPASMANFRNQAELNEFRRQWLLAFHENGINTIEQVACGMRVARKQERPFLPSPGQFVAWCKQSGGVLNVTTEDVITEYWDWRNRSFEFASSELFPWSKPVMYHICTELRGRSTEKQLTHSELEREASSLLEMWEKRVVAGKPIPPVRRALSAPAAPMGPTPAQMLMAKYKRSNPAGGSQS